MDASKIRTAITVIHALLLQAVFAVVPVHSHSAESIELLGYYKNYTVVLDPAEYKGSALTEQDLTGFINNRIRLSLDTELAEWVLFQAAYNFSLRIQDRSFSEDVLAVATIDPSVYRIADLDSRPYPSGNEKVKSFAIYHNLDRLFLTFTTGPADIYLGRQAIAWGSAHAINPTDAIAPFTFDELDIEDLFGVDALRIRIPIGLLGEFDCGSVFGKDFDFEKGAMYLRNRFYVVRTDVSTLLLSFRKNLMLGVDITRSIGGAGAWLETAYVFADALDGGREGCSKDYFRATIGCDYSFSGKLYSFIEYHINEAGAKEAEQYIEQLTMPAYTDGSVYLLGRHYMVPGLTLLITPLLELDSRALFNMADQSILIAPTADYNIAEDIYVSAGAYIGIGKKPELRQDAGLRAPLFHSEFGGYPDVYFVSLRLYF